MESEGEAEEMPSIHRLPREILEDIFFHLRPFGDLEAAALVCKLWRDIARCEFQLFSCSLV